MSRILSMAAVIAVWGLVITTTSPTILAEPAQHLTSATQTNTQNAQPTSPAGSSLNADSQEIHALISNFVDVVNTRNYSNIKSFIKFYFAKDLVFTKQSNLYDTNNTQKSIASNNLSMDRAAYTDHLINLLKPPDRYNLSFVISEVKPAGKNYIHAVVNMKELAQFNKGKAATKRQSTTTVHTVCNMSFRRSSSFILFASNCVESIVNY